MTSSLARLFRLGINKGEDTTSVYNEIEHVKSYLTIQKMRYKDKIDFKIDVDSEIFHYKVLKIILQPLAENSIYHGIKNMTGTGTITVTGRKTNDGILLQVIDNGLGMTPDEVAGIFEKSGESSNGSGVGVKNVNERIKLYFGNEYGLSFESAPDKGTTASILLPVIE